MFWDNEAFVSVWKKTLKLYFEIIDSGISGNNIFLNDL